MHRLGLALESDGVTGVEAEGALGGDVGRLADRDRHRRRHALQPRRRVDRVPGKKAAPRGGVDVEAHERVAGIDADANLQRRAVGPRQALEVLDQAQAGAHRALGVVLVHGGHAEHGHHRVPDELLHGAAMRLDGRAGASRVLAEKAVDVLRIRRLAHLREADDVAEERGDGAALFGAPRWARRCGQTGAAARAGGGALGGVVAAAGAGDHLCRPADSPTTAA